MTRRTALVLFTVLLPATLAAEAPAITVRLFDLAGVPETTLSQAVALTTQIYAEAGVTLKWVSEAAPKAEPAGGLSFRPNPSPIEVSVRLMPKHLSDRMVRRGSPRMGVAYAAGEKDYRYLASVFYDRVEDAAPALDDVSLPELLGHIMAHELGHLLLGPNAHARGTIMACPLESGEFRFLRRGQLRFSPKQAAQLRAQTAGRVEAAKLQVSSEPALASLPTHVDDSAVR